MCIAVDAHAAMAADTRALGIGDARIHAAPRGLAFTRRFHRLLRRQIPGMIEVEIGYVARQLFRIGEARAIVFGGVARDVAGLLDGFGDGARRKVRGAGRALALAEVHRDPHAAIALVFDRLDFPEANRGRQSFLQADIGFGLGSTQLARQLQRFGNDVLELGDSGTVYFLHGRIVRCTAKTKTENIGVPARACASVRLLRPRIWAPA